MLPNGPEEKAQSMTKSNQQQEQHWIETELNVTVKEKGSLSLSLLKGFISC